MALFDCWADQVVFLILLKSSLAGGDELQDRPTSQTLWECFHYKSVGRIIFFFLINTTAFHFICSPPSAKEIHGFSNVETQSNTPGLGKCR